VLQSEHNSSITFIYNDILTVALGHIKKKIGDRPFDFTITNQGRGRLFFYFFDDPKIKPVYALEPCKQVRVHPLAYLNLNKEEMVNLDLGVDSWTWE
jgi:hypothetical protein